jgi:elongation factor G
MSSASQAPLPGARKRGSPGQAPPTAAGGPASGQGALTRFRNFGIIAHIDAGKTTATERILYYTGKEHRMGEVHEGTTTMDYLPEERERGITITAAATTCYWKDHRLNLIDTPGHIDFTAEVQRSLRVLDGAIVIFSGVEGVEAQSETVWRQADRYGVPRICFVNKLDRPGADYWEVVSQIRRRLAALPLPLQMPLGKETGLRGVVDLVRMRQVVFDAESRGEKFTEGPIESALREEAHRRHDELFHLVADSDHEIGDIFLHEKKATPEQLTAAVRRVCLAGRGFPVLCGSAYRCVGIQPLLDAVLACLPSPLDLPPTVGRARDEPDKTVTRRPTPQSPLAALAFKILFDKHGDLTFLRIYSGAVASGSRVYNATRDRKERVDRLFLMHADERESVAQAGPGEIVAATGFKFTVTGDTLCTEEAPILLEPPKFPDTVVSMAIEPKTNDDKDRLARALARLAKEDPTFAHRYNQDTGQTIISGMGELHLDIIRAKLTREHSVEANIGQPRVSYREALTAAAQAEGRFIQQTGGHGQYGVCLLRIEPFANDGPGHIVFESQIRGGAIPREYIPAVERGCRSAASDGILSGYPLINVKITLLDGKFHEVDSSELAFEMAGTLGFKAAAAKAGPILLEPIMSLELVTPEEFLGNLIGDLNARRAEIQELGERGHLHLVRARVPLAEVFRYAHVSRSLSSGRASYTLEPCGYLPVPRSMYKQILGEG